MLTKKCPETIQVTDISARQSRNNWGICISISGQELLAKGLTYGLTLCTGMNIHDLFISLHKPNYRYMGNENYKKKTLIYLINVNIQRGCLTFLQSLPLCPGALSGYFVSA